MGLDTVELVIRFEEAFGITIPDEVAADLTTPRQVTYYVLSQLTLGEQTHCISQKAFYLLRKEFVSLLEIPRSEFHPRANLARLIPTANRKEVWATVTSHIGTTALPDLVRPAWLFSLLCLATLATALVVFDYSRHTFGSLQTAFWLSLLALITFAYFSALLTRSLKTHFRSKYQHAGEVANYLAIHAPHTFKKEWTREEVAQLVRQIIIDETGVTDFTEDSRFVQDMHLD